MKPQIFGAIACVGLAFTGCASAPEMSKMEAPAGMEQNIAQDATEEAKEVAAVAGEDVPRVDPQLVKTAEIDLEVESIDAIVTAITDTVKRNQGDILELQNNKPSNVRDRHRAFLRLRVPQQRLDRVLAEIGDLGIPQRQTLSAEDVSNQLVDLDARLRNLRKQEESLLKIMDRSGSVGDVLKVAQELGNIRAQIEQIDAQQKNLRDRVSFSTILVNLETATTTIPRSQPLGGQLGETWDNAVYGVSSLTTGLLKLTLWLLAFSPYWLAIGVAFWLIRKYGKKMTEKNDR
ncbi:DUF4349 domain-containing protein [Spirulina sp. 06S082]|uniref:DUF4349 domain-containing protein n=1 Tax=Spirulina sp. 06S082 TaxID=3110248 RepID=UPI002B206969|nr:DUF4349 domain-containing protein [Spirulina sp. 06S082]MEA5467381.1 DUF4349 domain-containing protein [Spirulina sp. 06S082]